MSETARFRLACFCVITSWVGLTMSVILFQNGTAAWFFIVALLASMVYVVRVIRRYVP